MPERDFMKSSKEKEMPEEEYKALRQEYDKKADEAGGRIKKVLLMFFVVFMISFAGLFLVGLFGKEANRGNGAGNYTWIAVEFLMAVFLYGIKAEDDKRYKYETDKRRLLDYVKNKITAYKIRLGLVIGFGTVFVILNIICWWFAITYLSAPEVDYMFD